MTNLTEYCLRNNISLDVQLKFLTFIEQLFNKNFIDNSDALTSVLEKMTDKDLDYYWSRFIASKKG